MVPAKPLMVYSKVLFALWLCGKFVLYQILLPGYITLATKGLVVKSICPPDGRDCENGCIKKYFRVALNLL
jgi:hypothetical protein